MSDSRQGGSPEGLPPITVRKMYEAGLLVERIVEEKTSVFIDKGHKYREQHRQGTSRPLSAQEAAQVAAGLAGELSGDLAENPGEAVARIQASGLRAYDEPDPKEVLLVAGLGTAPALMEVVCELLALVEMNADDFEKACENGQLDEELERRGKALMHGELAETRQRASAALEHVARASGREPGEAVGLLSKMVGQALGQAMSMLPSTSSSLIDSAAPTDGAGEKSSIDSPTRTPSPSSA